ncbi:MAG: helix-turn-helix transcriptional regulator, partial [Clostridia bacterium]|nr:helix-turn-helix transcriptional regulator [Clostridia bacterium]
MDMQKIGSFLAALRKERNLTQDELGAQIGVTNKTISRWETGSYLPPVEMLQTLGDTFGVSINEILNGERISDGNYKDISEQNLKSALTKSDSVIAKHRKIMNWVIAVVVAALYVTISLITLKWQYTWMIWAVYCAYRTVESI